MPDQFRVKVRVKKWKPIDATEWQRKINDQYRQAVKDAWKEPTVPPFQISTKCPRCGINWGAGPMGYCCPEGTRCGVPRRFDYQAPVYSSGGLVYKQPEGVTYQTWN